MKNSYYQFFPFNFGGIKDQDLKKAKIIIIPVPYEVTTSYQAGTRNGPRAIITASRHLDEIWGEKILSKIEKEKLIYTTEEIELLGENEKENLAGLTEFLKGIFKKNKIPFILGGEHTLSFGAVKALKEKFKNFSLLQLDAHPDLRDEYLGNKFSHACVMRRIEELGIKITAVGIRSVDCDVKNYIKEKKIKNIFYAPQIPVQKILKSLSKNVYLTFDFDALDSSIMPSVGTPQPGGLGYYEVLNLIEKVAKNKNIIGADFVEFSPIPGLIAPDFLAAKLIYKIITYILG